MDKLLGTPSMQSFQELGLFDRMIRYGVVSAGSSFLLLGVVGVGWVYHNLGEIHPHLFFPTLLTATTVAVLTLAGLAFRRLFRLWLRTILHWHRITLREISQSSSQNPCRKQGLP